MNNHLRTEINNKMPVYQYKGLRSDGQGTAGVIDAESLKGARHKLREGGVYPTAVSEQRQSDGVGRGSILSSGVGGHRPHGSGTRHSHATARDVIETAGLPLIDALAVLIEQTEKKSVQSLLAEVREQIRGGKALSRALEAFPKDFTTVYLHMVRAGEASGALEGILVRLAEFLHSADELKHKVTNATMYPVLMLVVAVAILSFLMVFVVPEIAGCCGPASVLPPTRLPNCGERFSDSLLACAAGRDGVARGDGAACARHIRWSRARRPSSAEDAHSWADDSDDLHLTSHQYAGHHAKQRCATS